MKKLVAFAISFVALIGITVSPANAAVTASLSKSTSIAYAGETINVTAAVPSGQGVYILLCKSPDAGSSAPTLCYGQGVWASMVNERGPLNAANPIPLAVKATFTSSGTKVDCTVSNCVVFIRRDHEGTVGGVRDLSLDTLIPVSFTAAPVTPAAVVPTEDQTISPFWPAKKYKATVSRKAKKRIARVAMLTTQGNALTYSSQTPKTCAVMISKKYVDIKFTSKGICNVTATAAATDTYKPTEFTWTYKVR